MLMRPSLKSISLFFAVLLLGSWSGQLVSASAPGGSPPQDAYAAYSGAELVFTGRVTATAKDKYGYDSIATVTVERVYKGQEFLRSSVTVSGAGGPTYPARLFRPGQVLLFYLGRDLHADSYLSRIVPADQDGDALKNIERHSPAAR